MYIYTQPQGVAEVPNGGIIPQAEETLASRKGMWQPYSSSIFRIMQLLQKGAHFLTH